MARHEQVLRVVHYIIVLTCLAADMCGVMAKHVAQEERLIGNYKLIVLCACWPAAMLWV